MKIANIELSKREDHSTFAKRYGGGSIFVKWARELAGIHDFAPKECFDNISHRERGDLCFILSEKQLELLNYGYPVKDIIPDAESYDIFIYNQENFSLNLEGIKAKQVCWFAFVNQTQHPNNPYLFLYSKDQKVRGLPQTKVFPIKIGDFIPKFHKNIKKEDFIFQCTRLDSSMDPLIIVKECIKNKVKMVLSGPIGENYPLLQYVDNDLVKYIGQIDTDTKINYYKRARLFNAVQNWDTIWNLSTVEANGYGTPLITSNRGFFKDYIKENVNGFFYDGSNFLDIWNKSNNTNQELIWKEASNYSEAEMVNSFYNNFNYILNDDRSNE